MTHALLLGDTTTKVMRIASLARQSVRDYHWNAIITGPLHFQIRKLDRHHQPQIDIHNRRQLTRIITTANDADVVYLVFDDSPAGELLAADVANQLLSRYPQKVLHRLALSSLTLDGFSRAFTQPRPINHTLVRAEQQRRHLNFLFTHFGEKLTGAIIGRAILPALHVLQELHRPKQSRIMVELQSGVRLKSDFISTEQASRLVNMIRPGMPVGHMDVTTKEVEMPPPEHCFTLNTLIPTACEITGARAIEVLSQLSQLYDAGFVTTASGELVASHTVHELIEVLVGKEAVGSHKQHYGIVPTSIETFPDHIPKPVRHLYRIIWARTLQAHSTTMRGLLCTGSVVVNGVRLTGESYVPVQNGHDHFSFGLFYRRGHISSVVTVASVSLSGGWPYEWELLRKFEQCGLGFESAARVIKALENAHYIEAIGPEVATTHDGRTALAAVADKTPLLLDLHIYRNTEQQLVAMRDGLDVGDVPARWDAWFRKQISAVKKEKCT